MVRAAHQRSTQSAVIVVPCVSSPPHPPSDSKETMMEGGKPTPKGKRKWKPLHATLCQHILILHQNKYQVCRSCSPLCPLPWSRPAIAHSTGAAPAALHGKGLDTECVRCADDAARPGAVRLSGLGVGLGAVFGLTVPRSCPCRPAALPWTMASATTCLSCAWHLGALS